MNARPATPADAPQIVTIYNAGIGTRLATFETEPRTVADILPWFTSRYPVVVAEVDGKVVAFAATSSYKPRRCYDGVAEFMVYVALEEQRQGYGSRALEALFREAERRGFHKLVSRIFVENYASRRLLASVGFREVGVYERHAQLAGVWRDVVIVERQLSPESLEVGT